MFIIKKSVKNVKAIVLTCFTLAVFGLFYHQLVSSLERNHQKFEVNLDDSHTLTRIIHQSWKTHVLPPRFQKWASSWIGCYSPSTFYPADIDFKSSAKGKPTSWTYRLWNDSENRKLVEDHYSWFLPTYDNFTDTIYRADAIRYLYMHYYGGIYADLDAECLQPFEHLLKNVTIVFGAMKGKYGVDIKEGYTQNSFMYSMPNQQFWMDLVKSIVEKMKSNPTARPEFVTGPIVLMQAIKDWRETKHEQETQITIYPDSYFNPISWLSRDPKIVGICKDLNGMSDSELSRCRSFFTNSSYVVQYHSQVWRAGKVL